jgi:hypothetical protein
VSVPTSEVKMLSWSTKVPSTCVMTSPFFRAPDENAGPPTTRLSTAPRPGNQGSGPWISGCSGVLWGDMWEGSCFAPVLPFSIRPTVVFVRNFPLPSGRIPACSTEGLMVLCGTDEHSQLSRRHTHPSPEIVRSQGTSHATPRHQTKSQTRILLPPGMPYATHLHFLEVIRAFGDEGLVPLLLQ